MTDLNSIAPSEVEAELTGAGTELEDPEEVTGQDTTNTPATPVPTAEELTSICSEIKANFDYKVNVKPTMFNFKTRKDEGGTTTKRESLELPIPYPSMDGLVDIMETGGKGLELLFDAVEAIIAIQVRALINDDYSISANNLPVDKLSWDFISKLPKAERAGGGISKEVWDAFAEDYVTTMQLAADKTVAQATRAASILKGKFTSIKTNKPVIQMLVGQMTVYADSSDRVTEFANCIEFLLDKAEKLLNTDSTAELLESL